YLWCIPVKKRTTCCKFSLKLGHFLLLKGCGKSVTPTDFLILVKYFRVYLEESRMKDLSNLITIREGKFADELEMNGLWISSHQQSLSHMIL
ncbi:hypothetical protein KM043_000073, partial [Ampulex compressa]